MPEMPFIGTRYMYRHQGMCRRPLTGIESALYSLNVERLVIPAVAEIKETWTSGFVENKISAEGVKSSELEEHQTMDEVADTAPHDESAAVESSLQLPVESSHNTSDVTSKTLKFSESITDSKCINQLGVIHDDVQESVKTAMNPLVSMLATKSVGAEVKSEDVIVQHNNFGDEASSHKSAEKTTYNQNLDLLQESKHSGETYFTHESEAKYLMTDDAKVTAGCCTTYTKCINQLDVAYDDVQGNDKTVTNPLGFVSDAGEENKEFNDCEVELRRASKLATKSISKVESEDVIVKQNNVGDKASVHHLVENNATDVQNLDLLQESKGFSENFFTQESKVLMFKT
ncbi:hypothetical protein LWI28_019571 [Acer negundo]|uniref:Increased DNA methylation 1 C-terminal domain-containing protein n=1 Tax=Acer negundo TaxID=4023 RepID=A0AAD5NYB5_ACENE|nr:hypothetical protein LWI28_019571 [Acer negundo]